MTEEPVEVIQADREAAQAWVATCADVSMDVSDAADLVQAFARHRLSHSAEKDALIEALEEAASAVLAHRVDGPTRGWIRDNRDSRAALDGLNNALLSMRNNGHG